MQHTQAHRGKYYIPPLIKCHVVFNTIGVSKHLRRQIHLYAQLIFGSSNTAFIFRSWTEVTLKRDGINGFRRCLLCHGRIYEFLDMQRRLWPSI